MKKIIIIICTILVIAAFAFTAFFYQLGKMHNTVSMVPIGIMDLSKTEDGKYTGEYGDFVLFVKVEVTVKDHSIKEIKVLKQNSGKGYEGRSVIEKIIEKQSLRVDTVTGASSSSKCIIVAVANALGRDEEKLK